MPTFSSKQYSWCDISVAIGGRILEGITELEYTEKKEKDYLYGRGCTPHGIVGGNRSAEGKIAIWQSELEAMTRDSKNKDVLSIEFDLIVSYVPHDGGQTVTDVLKGCQFTEVKKAIKQGDKNMIPDMPLIITRIERQK